MGFSQNRVKTDSSKLGRADARKNFVKEKKQEIGKQYIQIPHPILKNTFILKEKE